MGTSLKNAQLLLDSRLPAAMRGDGNACYDLGVAYSTGTDGADYDLVEAHKWFNLAVVAGNASAQAARAEIADDMSAREIAAAQRAARDIIATNQRRAA